MDTDVPRITASSCSWDTRIVVFPLAGTQLIYRLACDRDELLEEESMSTGKPEVDFPGGEPPSDLEITEIWEGAGKVASPGDMVQVHYVGVAYSTGEEFDASWDLGEPLEFRLGTGRVIEGWDQGVQGMKVGGRRQLIIPAHLAYGDHGAGNAIAPGETLIFVCDLVSA
jgi:peptidylprolyl isomerase